MRSSDPPPGDPGRYLGTPPDTLMATLGIEIVEATTDRVVATLPVGPAVHQPFGILHGGASVVLAETVASVAATLNAPAGMVAVGLEINANHLRPMRSGTLRAATTPVHRGRRTQVWRVELTDDEGRAVCVSRCTLALVPLEPPEASG